MKKDPRVDLELGCCDVTDFDPDGKCDYAMGDKQIVAMRWTGDVGWTFRVETGESLFCFGRARFL